MEWVSPTFLYSHVFMYHKMCTYCIPYSHFATCTCVLLNAFVCLFCVCVACVIFLACMFIHTIKPLTYPYLPKTYAQKNKNKKNRGRSHDQQVRREWRHRREPFPPYKARGETWKRYKQRPRVSQYRLGFSIYHEYWSTFTNVSTWR